MPSSLFMALTYLLKHVFAMIDMSIFSKFGCRLPPFFSSLAPLFFHSLSSTHSSTHALSSEKSIITCLARPTTSLYYYLETRQRRRQLLI